jgi:hypothetical protein
MTEAKILPLAPFLLASALLGGCASASDKYPSLAIRDAERTGAVPDATPEPTSTAPDRSNTPVASSAPVTREPTPLNTLSTSRIAQSRSLARREHGQFMRKLPAARRAVSAARGASQTSNAWGDAMVALADLDTHRSQTSVALGDLDAMLADSRVGLSALGSIAPAQREVAGMIRQQDRALASLRRGL